MTEIERIAAGLTKAQKQAILWLPSDGSWKDHRRGAKNGVSQTSLYCMEKRMRGDPRRRVAQVYTLTEHKFDAGERERGQMWRNTVFRLTPLGLAVRAHLEKRNAE